MNGQTLVTCLDTMKSCKTIEISCNRIDTLPIFLIGFIGAILMVLLIFLLYFLFMPVEDKKINRRRK